MQVGDVPPASRSVMAFVEAAERCGIARIDDISVAGDEGTGLLQATIHRGIRQTTYDAFIAPVRSRGSLTLWTGGHVRRVVVENRQARSVEIMQRGAMHTLHAAREVTVCAGTLKTPQLLMLSGIGNGDHLRLRASGRNFICPVLTKPAGPLQCACQGPDQGGLVA